MLQTIPPRPFENFAPPIRPQSELRRNITAAYRRPESDCVTALVEQAKLPGEMRDAVARTARMLVEGLRQKGQRGGVEGLVKEYTLSSEEGVALMCLAEALLRIPDDDTRDALIRDKIAKGDWRSHVGDGRPLFVNAATWGLVVSGKLTTPVNETGLGSSLTRLISRLGEPVIRSGVNRAMELMGDQFVRGETIEEALKRAKKQEKRGFTYSYDMLGEAAMTMADADRYYRDYEHAIHAIGQVALADDIYSRPGISIKLSALHPRYSRDQAGRVMAELLPRVRELALLARHYGIGLNIDAEEADRLELSLDILEELALDADLADWNGLGFVIQAYGKRCPNVIDWIVDLARRAGRRIMVRLVKGAYWDTEIKRAQVDGLADFPVFTRKVHTDVSYIACARKLLEARKLVFPQFATHNAQTLASIFHLAGDRFTRGDYEFQCLHGMGEALYEEVVGSSKLDRPCRIYAPVGTHETLLAYLVRRLLENGANSSFVNQIWDPAFDTEALVADPVSLAEAVAPLGSPHDAICLPGDLYAARRNSTGPDLSDETDLKVLSVSLFAQKSDVSNAVPMIPGLQATRPFRDVRNPANHSDVIGKAAWAVERDAQFAARIAVDAFPSWVELPVDDRAACLERAADLMQERMPFLLGLAIREAGKSMPNAIAEVREAIDFLRYYAWQARETFGEQSSALGPITCISPWNFPLAIFTGQVAAALVAGNTVLAKPAEETPLIAAEAVRILHQAGIPEAVLQFLPGDGAIGAALVAAPETSGVIFTGSTEVAKLIQAELAGRLDAGGAPLPLIAETGGQNAMIVDSTALPEQVVADVIASAFDSAGQRCSALRILCIQEDVADSMLVMLKGALAELTLGSPDRLAVDVGPVISEQARETINAHVERMRALGCKIEQLALPDECDLGTFVPPTIVEIDDIADLGREVFGPVLHVLRYRREELYEVINKINATGYGLTFGLHTRIGETIDQVSKRVEVGNIYINRNVIGAIVGVQPFGGRGLSGTGPKAGGPLYLHRLKTSAPECLPIPMAANDDPALRSLETWLSDRSDNVRMVRALAYRSCSPRTGVPLELPGPVGEQNLYRLAPRGRVLLLPETQGGLVDQLLAVIATGNTPCIESNAAQLSFAQELPDCVSGCIQWVEKWQDNAPFDHVLIERGAANCQAILADLAGQGGPIPIVQISDSKGHYRLDWMLEEISVSIDTTAAGGNASLMALV